MSAAHGRKRRRVPKEIVIESDLPPLTGILPWERELLVPIVERMVEEALADHDSTAQTRTNEEHAEDQDEEP